MSTLIYQNDFLDARIEIYKSPISESEFHVFILSRDCKFDFLAHTIATKEKLIPALLKASEETYINAIYSYRASRISAGERIQ